MSARLAGLQDYRYLLLIGQLVLLLLVLVEGPDSWLGRTLWLGHVGLFLIWQPFVAGESRLTPMQIGVVVMVVAAVSTTLGWGWLAGWLALFAAIIGGKVVMARNRRFGVFYLFIFAFLLFTLLVWVAPQIVGGTRIVNEVWVDLIAMILLAGAGLAIPARRAAEVSELYDFVASFLLLLLLAVLLLGTTSIMALAKVDYFNALLRTLFGMAAILLLLSWAWNPRPGFGGFGVFVSTYLMRLGFPFDAWLKRLIALAETEEEPGTFLRASMETFSALPWVTGGSWQHGSDDRGAFGVEARHETLFVYGGVHLRLYTGYVWTASLIWQGSLLLKLVVELYRAKLHERAARQMRFMQSIHETGARLTHDVKNLLQSLDSLCFAAERTAADKTPESSQQLADLVRRQLPVVAERLRSTVDRLSHPAPAEASSSDAATWWRDFTRRFSREGVVFLPLRQGEGCIRQPVPTAVFDSVAENLISNALGKRRETPGLVIRASLDCWHDGVELRVQDNGDMIPTALAAKLFVEPVESRSGLGIGLYQACRLAAVSGWQLRLAENRPGAVAFTLSAAPVSGRAADGSSSVPSP
jgi:signal transduction histidine kinase